MSSIQKLVDAYPLLFIAPEFREEAIETGSEKEIARMYIECDDGWENIIESFFDTLYMKVYHAKYLLEHCHPEGKDQAKQNLEKTIQELPYVTQIKEKFGILSIYTDSCEDSVYDLIIFAERMSERTCEVCGNKGELSSRGGWLQTLCPTHAKEKGAKPCKQ